MMKTYKILLTSLLVLVSSLGFSQSVPSYVPTSGLVGWWGFNGNAQDGSGNGNHGTVINGGVTQTLDRFSNSNSAYFFDGSDSWISIPYSGSLYFDNFYTVSVWFKKIGSTNSYAGDLITKERDVSPGSITVRVMNTLPNIMGISAYNVGGAQSISSIVNGQWYHMVGTFDNGVVKIYVNGVLEHTTVNPNNQIGYNTNPFWIGKQKGTGWPGFFYLWNGSIDDIGMWNRALSQQEITNLYNSQLPTQTSLCLPTITTTSPSSVGVDSVVIGGNITNDGGSSIVLRGVCYSTSPNPNMGNSRTEDGSGTGSFNTVLRGLTSSTTYYAKSYAKNSNGVVVYGNEITFTTSSITIGSNFAGGIVFYVDSTGQHGLVCAPSDQGVAEWGCNCFEIGGLSFSLGSGLTNTNRITSICLQNGIAAEICSNLQLNGYSDWFLPSINELQLMWNNLRGTPNSPTPNLANFSTQSPYWSSSEPSNYPCYALAIDFWQGNMVTRNKYMGQNYGSRVRAIRSF